MSLHLSSFQGHVAESAPTPLIGQSTFTNADWIVGQQLCDVGGSQQSENDTDEKRGSTYSIYLEVCVIPLLLVFVFRHLMVFKTYPESFE